MYRRSFINIRNTLKAFQQLPKNNVSQVLPKVFLNQFNINKIQYSFCNSNSQGGSNMSNNNNNNNNNNEIKLNTYQLEVNKKDWPEGYSKRWINPSLTEKEMKQKQKTQLLVHSPIAVSPYGIANVQVNSKDLDKINSVCIFSDKKPGEIYLVGLQLDSTQFKKQLNKNSQIEGILDLPLVCSQKNYRVKISEIVEERNVIYCKTISYRDTKDDSLCIDVESELETIRNCLVSIRDQFQTSVFIKEQDFLSHNYKQFNKEQIDLFIWDIIKGFTIFENQFFQKDLNKTTQQILESNSIKKRVFILKLHSKQVEETSQIISQALKKADDTMKHQHIQTQAEIAQEAIRIKTKQKEFHKKKYSQEYLLQGYKEKLKLIEPEESRNKIKTEIQRFEKLDKSSSEYSKLNVYLDEVFSVPWKSFTEPFYDINYAEKSLELEVYGLEEVKDRIIQMIAVNKLNKQSVNSKGIVFLISGPPGTGKSSIAKAIAKALKRPYRFISFAGVSDVSFIKGHRRTYVDSQPGIFIQELIKSKTMNPVLILDEFDKVGINNINGNPYSALLELLNPEENHHFNDHYLDIPVDFSKAIFILTANNLVDVLEPLMSRIEVLEINGYIEEEKLKIASNYIIPKVIQNMGLPDGQIVYNNEILRNMITGWCYYEAGVREFKKCFEQLCRKYIVEIINQEQSKESEQIIFPNENSNSTEELQVKQMLENNQIAKLDLTQDSQEKLIKYLGNPLFDQIYEQRIGKSYPFGTCNILSASTYTGHVNLVELEYDNSISEKKGQVTYSGNIEQVLQESINIARKNAFNYLTDEEKLQALEKNVHMHFNSAAIKKDGPSAGGALTTSFLSLLKSKQIPSNVAQTGEISLNGRICKIGGLQSKIIAAKAVKIEHIILSQENYGDLMRLNKDLLKGLTIYFVNHYNQIYEMLFEDKLNKPSIDVIIVRDGEQKEKNTFVQQKQIIENKQSF